MKKLIMIICCLFLMGCINANIPGMGIFQTDPGVRVYKTETKTVIHITHKANGTLPDYEKIAPLLKGIFDD